MKLRRSVLAGLAVAWLWSGGEGISAQTWSQLVTSGSPPTTGVDGGGYDTVNNRLIGYFPSTSGGQVWVLTNANGLGGSPVWTQLVTSGPAPTENGAASVVYDSATNQLIVYGGCLSSCGAPLSDVSVLSNANGLGGAAVWTPSTTNPPEARDNQSAVYNPANKTMIAFGGGLAFFGTDQNDTRVLAPANEPNSSWNALSPLGPLPGDREEQKAVYD